jgi:hypothetical protein
MVETCFFAFYQPIIALTNTNRLYAGAMDGPAANEETLFYFDPDIVVVLLELF